VNSKSAFVFKSSAENFIEEAVKNKRKVYFWTFTFRECTTVAEGSKKWSELLQALKRNFVRIAGVRRYELHPGGHGLHIHCLFDSRLDVNQVRPIAKKLGFGRIHVMKVEGSDAKKHATYIAKYLSKGDRPFCFKGRRLWANIGEYVGYKVKDCEVHCPFIDFFRRIRKLLLSSYPADVEKAKEEICSWCPHFNFDDMKHPRCFFWKLLWLWRDYRPCIRPSRDLDPQIILIS